ncbi:hypothetical protein [Clostridium ljungdahlii]|uniref:Uncharacterized protein n=1 Tax=Clostridium ljungdahlii TaxID=1538 RepID=A0A162L1T4_9CLOT|nr:hypothetical protein [Clostridium ljungdahlii]OAA83188.1 hypothetical protein WY13_03516 [Clostridium ljungdahlii]
MSLNNFTETSGKPTYGTLEELFRSLLALNIIQSKIGVLYDTDISEKDAESIDAVEKIFIDLNRKVLKKGISDHLENILKKSRNTRNKR